MGAELPRANTGGNEDFEMLADSGAFALAQDQLSQDGEVDYEFYDWAVSTESDERGGDGFVKRTSYLAGLIGAGALLAAPLAGGRRAGGRGIAGIPGHRGFERSGLAATTWRPPTWTRSQKDARRPARPPIPPRPRRATGQRRKANHDIATPLAADGNPAGAVRVAVCACGRRGPRRPGRRRSGHDRAALLPGRICHRTSRNCCTLMQRTGTRCPPARQQALSRGAQSLAVDGPGGSARRRASDSRPGKNYRKNVGR